MVVRSRKYDARYPVTSPKFANVFSELCPNVQRAYNLVTIFITSADYLNIACVALPVLHTHSLTLNLNPRLSLVKRHKPLDLVHTLLGCRIIPRCILDLGLVRRNRVVAGVALVRAVCFGRCGAKVRRLDGVGWELWGWVC